MKRQFLSSAVLMAVVFFATASALAGEDPIVATINGVAIHASSVDEAQTRLPPQFKDLPTESIYMLLVNSLIDTNLAAIEARRQGMDKKESHKSQIIRIEDQILERTLLAGYIKSQLSEDAIKKRYDTFVKESAVKNMVRARHILLDNEDKAKKLIDELEKGADFAELAKNNSIGPSASKGGDLGYFAKDQMVPEFSSVAFTLADGEFGKTPVKTQFGWHVIKVEGHRKGKAPTFDEAKSNVRSLLSNEIGAKYIDQLRNGAKIEIFNHDGSPINKGTLQGDGK